MGIKAYTWEINTVVLGGPSSSLLLSCGEPNRILLPRIKWAESL